jgi:hypothetical protein
MAKLSNNFEGATPIEVPDEDQFLELIHNNNILDLLDLRDEEGQLEVELWRSMSYAWELWDSSYFQHSAKCS